MSLAEALSGASNVRGFAQRLLRNREERSRFNLHALLLLLDCLAYLQLEARIADKAPRRVWKKYAEETVSLYLEFTISTILSFPETPSMRIPKVSATRTKEPGVRPCQFRSSPIL